MARPQSPAHADKRSDILRHAALLFARDGYAATSMQGIADACGLSKATLYHYHRTKDALLFDLLNTYTQRLLVIVAQSEAAAQRKHFDDRAALHELLRQTLAEYETAGATHAVLLNDAKHLPPEQHQTVVKRQRDLVAAFGRFLMRAYPQRISAGNVSAHTMMLFGMINWTFTWLKADGPLTYAGFAEQVVALLESGLRTESPS